ncbi:MAG TPA: hypothetical protein VKI40_11305 [Terriglobales bacterium]|nr:hypothetical protein [Terriglobales bacterium]
MVSKHRKHYLFASDFDQTLTFNDTGYVLSELLGISVEEFERKAKGMAKLNLVQQGAARIPQQKPINMRLLAIPSF